MIDFVLPGNIEENNVPDGVDLTTPYGVANFSFEEIDGGLIEMMVMIYQQDGSETDLEKMEGGEAHVVELLNLEEEWYNDCGGTGLLCVEVSVSKKEEIIKKLISLGGVRAPVKSV